MYTADSNHTITVDMNAVIGQKSIKNFMQGDFCEEIWISILKTLTPNDFEMLTKYQRISARIICNDTNNLWEPFF